MDSAWVLSTQAFLCKLRIKKYRGHNENFKYTILNRLKKSEVSALS